jgi:hypothetical protein
MIFLNSHLIGWIILLPTCYKYAMRLTLSWPFPDELYYLSEDDKYKKKAVTVRQDEKAVTVLRISFS